MEGIGMSNDITNEQLFEFMTKMYGEMQEGFKEVKNEIKKTNTKIDHEVLPKLNALFDGHKQNADKLDRIEEEVSKHEEIILRRIK
jgi:uncharacterized protein YijF (DUF1287 family)